MIAVLLVLACVSMALSLGAISYSDRMSDLAVCMGTSFLFAGLAVALRIWGGS